MDLSTPQQKYACTLCARRKIKCDRIQPCHNCSKSQAECQYQNPATLQRHRKRGADSEALARISQYEELLREHNIEFNAYSNDSNWISWEKTSVNSPSEDQMTTNAPPVRVEQVIPGPEEKTLWSSLSSELQNPSLNRRLLSVSDQPEEDPETNFLPFSTIAELIDLHPEPRHIFKLWEIFVENANPLIKIVHVPTLQQRIVESSWNVAAVSRQTEALMFAIYLLAVVSLSSSDCQRYFAEDKGTLIKRYRIGAVQALMAAGLFSTRDLEVLQAFVLFLLAAPNSETSTTLMAVAVRIGQKMGLHVDKPSSKLSFFEKEMRVRIWWQIQCFSARTLQGSADYIPPLQDPGNVRMPLNLNDSELHPNMVNRPVEHVGATEMMYCLLKYEGARWQQVARSAKKPSTMNLANSQAVSLKDQAICDLERTFEEKYLRYCDPRIPLHFLSLTMSRLAVSRIRFRMYHPQGRVDGGTRMMPEERDMLFDQSIRLLELENESRKTNFSPQLLTHMARSQLDALIYMLYELRSRGKGDRVSAAWNLVALFFEQHRELVDKNEKGNGFLDALRDLTLDAWQVRWNELEGQGGRIPWYIEEMKVRRPRPTVPVSSGSDQAVEKPSTNLPSTRVQPWGEMENQVQFFEMPVDFGDEYTYDAEYWSEFLQM